MSSEPTDILQELAKRFKGKLSRCQIYDANICTSRPVPDRPWELAPVSGEPFSRRLRYTYRGRRVALLENDSYVRGTVKGTFATRPFSINAKQRVGFRSEYAGILAVFAKQYPFFTEDGRSSQDQKDLLDRVELISLVQQGDLQEGEIALFTKDEMTFYLNQPTSDRVSRIIDRMIDLAAKIEIPEEKLDLKLLPVQFHPVIPLIEKWALPDDSDRNDRLDTTPESTLRALVDEVNPYLAAVDSYLDSFRGKPPTEEAVALGRLAECAFEAKQRLSEKNAF